MDREQLMNALRAADAAGDTEAAQRFAQMINDQSTVATPKRTFGEMLFENVIGRGEVDTPGERLGELVRGGGAATARGIADVPALPANLAQLGALGYEKATGAELGSSALSRGLASLPDTRSGLSYVTGGESDYVAPGVAGQLVAAGGEAMGAGGLMGGAKALIPAATSGLGSETAARLAPAEYETAARIAGGLAGAGIGAVAQSGATVLVDRIRSGALRSEFMRNTESVDKLKSAATRLYDDARANGVTATPAQTSTMANNARATLVSEGAVTPRGSMADYPKLKHAMTTLDDYAGEPMNPTQILTVRRTLQDAARSMDPPEARLGMILRNQFDAATGPLAPQIAQANALYGRMAQGELIEKTVELAQARAAQFSGSGLENALRTEFRKLDRALINGTIQATADEAAMISHISRGGPLENILRNVGKAAPTGAVSASLGATAPFYIGNTVGGPIVGGAAAVTVPAIGALSRSAATKLQSGNADFLSAIARAGGKAPLGTIPSASAGISLGQDILTPAVPGLLAEQSQRR